MSDLAISAEHLRRSFGSIQALADVSLAVPAGTVCALLGPNGAGKTTTVRLLATLLRPDGGHISIRGIDALREPQRVRALIGLSGQTASVDNKLTGHDNLTLFGRLQRLSMRDARARSRQLLQEFDLTEAGDRVVKTYSGGMRRRLDLAVSVVVAPPVLFLDEPSAGLDPTSRRVLWTSVRRLVDQGTTVLLTTHYLDEADQLADAVLIVDRGRIVAKGSPAELKASVGVARLDITCPTLDAFTQLRALLSDQPTTANSQTRTVSVSVDNRSMHGLRALKSVIERVAATDLAVDQYALREPTLDDVFEQLTEHPVESPAGQAGAA